MATVTVSSFTSCNHPRPKPSVSSPLAVTAQGIAPSSPRPVPKRNTSFPSSRPLRPFASISNAFIPPNQKSAGCGKPANGKQVKLIEPPKNHRGTFVLNLTQAEFSRQD